MLLQENGRMLERIKDGFVEIEVVNLFWRFGLKVERKKTKKIFRECG
jgi:hypothetical protein